MHGSCRAVTEIVYKRFVTHKSWIILSFRLASVFNLFLSTNIMPTLVKNEATTRMVKEAILAPFATMSHVSSKSFVWSSDPFFILYSEVFFSVDHDSHVSFINGLLYIRRSYVTVYKFTHHVERVNTRKSLDVQTPLTLWCYDVINDRECFAMVFLYVPFAAALSFIRKSVVQDVIGQAI